MRKSLQCILLVLTLTLAFTAGVSAQDLGSLTQPHVFGAITLNPTFIQTIGCTTGCTSLAFTSSVGSGHTIIACARTSNNVLPGSVTDTLGTTYTLAGSQNDGTTQTGMCYVGKTTLGGANTVSFNAWTGGFTQRMIVTEFSGLNGTVSNEVGGFTDTTTFASWTQTIPSVSGIVFAFGAQWGSGNTFSTFSPFTLGGTSNFCATQYWKITSSSSLTTSFSAATSGHSVGLSFVVN